MCRWTKIGGNEEEGIGVRLQKRKGRNNIQWIGREEIVNKGLDKDENEERTRKGK